MQIEVGQRVKANDLVVRLANDALLDRLVTLEEKALTLQKAEDRMTLLSMKIDMHRRGIQRLERQIKQERQIGQEMPYYLIEGKLKDWLVLVEQKSDELAVLEAEARLLQARQPDRNRILAHLSDRTATLTEAVEALDIRAPFNGVVTQAAAGDQRAKAPDQVLEICNEDSLVVEASAWQHQIAYIRPGVAVQVFPNLFEAGAPLSGTVRSIGAAKVGSGNDRFPVFPVLIDLDQAPTDLLAGMSVSVVILLQEASRGDLP
jgi:multidrug resistance efflux pump